MVQSTISRQLTFTYGKKYNKSLLSYCIKYNKSKVWIQKGELLYKVL
jgi:hypothetical protein